MVKTFTSKHIKKSKMDKDEAALLKSDILLYNHGLRKMVGDLLRPPRPKEQESIHCQYKRELHMSDYMVTSIESQAKGAIKAAEECLKLNIEAQELKIVQLDKKLASLYRRLQNLLLVKNQMIDRSKARAENKALPSLKLYRGCPASIKKHSDGSLYFEIPYKGKKSKKQKSPKPKVFENEYLFELLWLDPQIHMVKTRMAVIKSRMHNTVGHVEVLKEKLRLKQFSICFGGRKLASAQYRNEAYLSNHKHWKNTWEKRRLRGMTLAGRSDATQGNFMVSYDIESRVLTYRGRDGKTMVRLNNVVFPYGQEFIDDAVSRSALVVALNKKNRRLPPEEKILVPDRIPVTWSISDCGNAFLVRCTVLIPEPEDMNFCYSGGCIGFDMNLDRIAVSETGSRGELLSTFNVKFDMEKKTSNQIENMLSEALETVFRYAKQAKKPIVMEDIRKIKNKDSLYGSKKRNRNISMFAYETMDAMAQSKSLKYGLSVKKVNPAYTSQIGKLKYMKRYGISVHEAASYVIARRGMGYSEKIPKGFRTFLPEEKKRAHRWSQWASLSSMVSKVPVHKFYQAIDFSKFKNSRELVQALRA